MMKDNPGFSTISTVSTPALDSGAAKAPRADDRSIEEWAAIFAATGFAQATPVVRPLSLSDSEPADAWHHGDGAVTPGGPGGPEGASEKAPTKDSSRVDLRVDAADLGELSIAIDRMDSGIRVTIAAPDERAMRALEPERLRLLDVLTGTGVRVDSVTVVRATAAGIPLAQASERAADDTAETRANVGDKSRRRSQKKNYFVG